MAEPEYQGWFGLPSVREQVARANELVRAADTPGNALAALASDPVAAGLAGTVGPGALGRMVRPPPARVRAYHGSPYDFERFDISKLGSGEGAQSFGRGLYFAENEGVARSYRDALKRGVSYKGKPPGALGGSDNSMAVGYVSHWINERGTTPAAGLEQARAALIKEIADNKRLLESGQLRDYPSVRNIDRTVARIEYDQAILREVDKLDAKDFSLDPGRMYEVEINAPTEAFFDWDAPLSRQPEQARALFNELRLDAPAASGYVAPRGFDRSGRVVGRFPVSQGGVDLSAPGNFLYGTMAQHMPRGAPEALMRDYGLPGIRYLDQGSRAAGQGSRNYVVFDDSLINILRKYAMLPPAVGLGANALAEDGGP